MIGLINIYICKKYQIYLIINYYKKYLNTSFNKYHIYLIFNHYNKHLNILFN